jgi:hypothetical protein
LLADWDVSGPAPAPIAARPADRIRDALRMAADKGAAKDLDLHRMGWLPSDVYDVGEGLPDPTVNAIAVLPGGQAWVGTMRGLARQSGPRMLAEHGPDGLALTAPSSTGHPAPATCWSPPTAVAFGARKGRVSLGTVQRTARSSGC